MDLQKDIVEEATGKIGALGGAALMVASMTGPGLTVVPLIFQQAGWLPSLICLIGIGFLCALAALFMVQAMASVKGNESFQSGIEYTTLAELFLGSRYHFALQVVLYLALQSVTCASLVISCQSIDSMLISIFGKTCAVSFQHGWICATSYGDGSSPFSDYILFSFGFIVTFAMVVPLGFLDLVQNIKIQLISVCLLFVILIEWIVDFGLEGFRFSVPMVGDDPSQLIGFVILNFAFVTTVPSFVNDLHPSVSIHRSIWIPTLLSTAMYLLVGWLGASSYHLTSSSDILSAINAGEGGVHVLNLVASYLFPIVALVASVPVFSIVLRYNFVRGAVCRRSWAIFWANFAPWIVIIPFQTNGLLQIFMNWTSLIFTSTANLVIPFVLFILSKRYIATAIHNEDADVDVYALHPRASTSSRQSMSMNSPKSLASKNLAMNGHEPTPSPMPVPAIIVNGDTGDTGDDHDEQVLVEPSTSIRTLRSPSIRRASSAGRLSSISMRSSSSSMPSPSPPPPSPSYSSARLSPRHIGFRNIKWDPPMDDSAVDTGEQESPSPSPAKLHVPKRENHTSKSSTEDNDADVVIDIPSSPGDQSKPFTSGRDARPLTATSNGQTLLENSPTLRSRQRSPSALSATEDPLQHSPPPQSTFRHVQHHENSPISRPSLSLAIPDSPVPTIRNVRAPSVSNRIMSSMTLQMPSASPIRERSESVAESVPEPPQSLRLQLRPPFKALPFESKFMKPLYIAQVCAGISCALVLGNLVYVIIDTVK